MNSRNPEWPIHPKWLSIKKDVPENKVKPNSEGLFNPYTLRGFIADASAEKDIQNVISLFQVVPKGYEYEAANERIERIDNSIIRNNYIKNILKDREIIRIDIYENKPCCTAFRYCNDNYGNNCKNKCFDLDSRVALFYHQKLESIHFNNEYDKYIETLSGIVEEYNDSMQKVDNEYKAIPVELPVSYISNDKGYKSVYIKYQCFYSRLDEFIFPVIHSGKVIAVTILGQRPHKGLKKEDMFKYFLENICTNSESDKDSKDKLTQSIAALSDDFFNGESFRDEMKEAIFNRIKDLEERTDDAVLSVAQKYVSEKFRKIEKDYRDCLQETQPTKNNIVLANHISSHLDKALSEISQEFNKSGFMRIYTRKPEIETIDKSKIEFTLIGNSITTSEQFKSEQRQTILQFRALPSQDINKISDLEERLQSTIPSFQDNDFFKLKTQFSSKMGYVVWERNDSWKENYPEQYKLYARSLKATYPSLLEPYFILRSLGLEENLERAMRFAVHESAQIIPAVIDSINTDDTRKTIEENLSEIRTFNITIPSYKVIDSTQRLMLLERIFRTSTMIFKKTEAKLEWHDFYRIVYATDSLFSRKTREDNEQYLNIDFETQLKHYDIYTDYGFMSHILFNLIDNAIKYGFRGTNILFKVKQKKDSRWNLIDELQLSIVSFGNEIKEKDRGKIFDLYYRPDESVGTEGMGIGLFLAKQLCHSMGYKIECMKSVLVKNINLPYYFYYKEAIPNYRERTLSNNTVDCLDTPIEESKVTDVVNNKIKKWRISDFELEENLYMPIYKNEFVITIPINKNTLKYKL
jgi:Osmosensitive K+ channel histidine kinase